MPPREVETAHHVYLWTNSSATHGQEESNAPVLVFSSVEPFSKGKKDAQDAGGNDHGSVKLNVLRLAIEAIPDRSEDACGDKEGDAAVVETCSGIEEAPSSASGEDMPSHRQEQTYCC